MRHRQLRGVAMLRLLTAFALLLLDGLHAQACAQKLHFISVAQTNLNIMQDEFDANETYFSEYIELLSKKLGIPVEPTDSAKKTVGNKILGDLYNCENITKAVDEVAKKAESNDIVVFFFSGHGNASANGFPQIECSQYANDAKQPLLKGVYDVLRKSKARLVFVGADTCNNSVGAPSRLPSEQLTELRTKSEASRSDVMLFKSFTGGILLASSRVRQRSFYFERSHGRFTERLRNILLNGVESKDAGQAWKVVVDQLEAPIDVSRHDQQVGENPFQSIQRPFALNELHFAPAGMGGPVEK
jgi:caspase domain-containing protein